MRKQRSSIDGFTPRRAGKSLTGHIGDTSKPISKFVDANGDSSPLTSYGSVHEFGKKRTSPVIGRSDIDESLKDIDDSTEKPKKISRRARKRMEKRAKKQHGRAHKIIKWTSIVLLTLLVVAGGYIGYKFIAAGNNIFQGSFLDIFQSQPLKKDSNGRSNFLILGTSEDDPGHGGANLTDSMMIVSIDQKNKNIFTFSIPRDLYVEYGEACLSGYSGKINVYFSCSDEGTNNEAEQNRLTKTQKLVGDIFGLDIQYGVHVNHTVIKEAVNAVGGVDVDVQGSNGAPGVLDRNFDWRCNFKCYLVKYDNGIHHLDGEHALYLSMARGDVAPTYGLANSNFDREKNQQKILIALKEKAMSTGTLTNYDTVIKLIDSFGNNMRTNIKTSEIRTLMQVTSEVKTSNFHMLSLFDEDNRVVTTGAYNGASVVMPVDGIYNYSGIQAFIRKNLSNDPVAKEAAPIAIMNGTGQTGYGQSKADLLTKQGFNVSTVGNAPDGSYENVEVYQIGTGNTGTAKKLADMYKITVKKTKPPVVVNGNIRFVIIFGAVTQQ
ncbi:LCP family protein [Candidatus Saccharibacteria bacterium]|nr:LCP family protein [Candidatus Saccharibacteria bacterium]